LTPLGAVSEKFWWGGPLCPPGLWAARDGRPTGLWLLRKFFVTDLAAVGRVLRAKNAREKFMRVRTAHHEMLILIGGFAKPELGTQVVPKRAWEPG